MEKWHFPPNNNVLHFKCKHTGKPPHECQHWQCIILSVSWVFTPLVTRCRLTQAKAWLSPQRSFYNLVAPTVSSFLHLSPHYRQASTWVRSSNSKEGCHLFPSLATASHSHPPSALIPLLSQVKWESMVGVEGRSKQVRVWTLVGWSTAEAHTHRHTHVRGKADKNGSKR